MTNYSYETSLPAYEDNKSLKQTQEDTVVEKVKELTQTTLIELSKHLSLPQSTISGRCNDAIRAKRLKYEGFIVWEGRKRKRIVTT